MPIKRLIDSAIFGLGATAGRRLFEELEEKIVGKEKEEETPEQKTAREKKERKERERAEKLAAKEAKKAEEAKRKEKARVAAEVEDELAAMKKRLKK
jgi:hypothetical protein